MHLLLLLSNTKIKKKTNLLHWKLLVYTIWQAGSDLRGSCDNHSYVCTVWADPGPRSSGCSPRSRQLPPPAAPVCPPRLNPFPSNHPSAPFHPSRLSPVDAQLLVFFCQIIFMCAVIYLIKFKCFTPSNFTACIMTPIFFITLSVITGDAVVDF